MKKIILVIISMSIFGHGDHSTPGSLPPAPHGGVIKEAKHIHSNHKHDHKEAMKREIFFEVSYENQEVKIHLLELNPKNYKDFITLGLKKIEVLSFKVVDARKKRTVSKEFTNKEEFLYSKIENKRARRLLIELSVKINGAKFKETVQVERR